MLILPALLGHLQSTVIGQHSLRIQPDEHRGIVVIVIIDICFFFKQN